MRGGGVETEKDVRGGDGKVVEDVVRIRGKRLENM